MLGRASWSVSGRLTGLTKMQSAVLLLMFLATCLTVAQLLAGVNSLHGNAVSVVAPPVFVSALNEKSPSSSTLFIEATNTDTARDQMRRGVTSAALILDLRGTQDELLVDQAREPAFNKLVTSVVLQTEGRQGRSVAVTAVDLSQETQRVPVQWSRYLAAGSLIAGLLIAVVVSVVPGSRAWSVKSYGRVIVLTAMSVAVLLVAMNQLQALALAAICVMVIGCLVSVTLALALQSMAGLLGIAAYCAASLIFITPAALLADLDMVPEVVRHVWNWTPFGAVFLLMRACLTFGETEMYRPLLLCLVWLTAALLALRMTQGKQPSGTHRATQSRMEVGFIVAAFTAVLVAATAMVPSAAADPAPAPPVAANTLSRCVLRPPPKSVRALNRTASSPGAAEFQGGDVGVDVLLQDGRRVWIFADTLRGNSDAMSIVRNSMLVRDGPCLRAVLTPYADAVIPEREASGTTAAAAYWPMSAVKVSRPGYDLIYVTTQRIQRTGEDQLDILALGPSIAVLIVPTGGVPQVVTVADLERDSSDVARPMWGAATAMDGNWLYLYATANPGTPGVYGFSLRVARVPIEMVTDREAWTFWNGYSWSIHERDAMELIPAIGGTSQTLSVFQKNDIWYALSKRNEFMGTDLTVWTAVAPTGPFYPGPVLAQLPSDPVTGSLLYMPLAHPDLLPRRDSVIVSYSQNDTNIDDVLNDPRRYRPHFLRVWLPTS